MAPESLTRLETAGAGGVEGRTGFDAPTGPGVRTQRVKTMIRATSTPRIIVMSLWVISLFIALGDANVVPFRKIPDFPLFPLFWLMFCPVLNMGFLKFVQ
jgi:hypothetical protein